MSLEVLVGGFTFGYRLAAPSFPVFVLASGCRFLMTIHEWYGSFHLTEQKRKYTHFPIKSNHLFKFLYKYYYVGSGTIVGKQFVCR